MKLWRIFENSGPEIEHHPTTAVSAHMTRDQLLNAGVDALRTRGWNTVNKTNILMDRTYSSQFSIMLHSGYARLRPESPDREVFEKLIAEIDGYTA